MLVSATPQTAHYQPMGEQLYADTKRGFAAASTTVDRLIDRATELRVQMRNDLKAKTFPSDTLHGVDLLVRARDYAIGSLEKSFPQSVRESLGDWHRANRQNDATVQARTQTVINAKYALDHSLQDLLDDDEGNVRESIQSMRTNPGANSWGAVFQSLDGALGNLYDLRSDFANVEQVLMQERSIADGRW